MTMMNFGYKEQTSLLTAARGPETLMEDPEQMIDILAHRRPGPVPQEFPAQETHQ